MSFPEYSQRTIETIQSAEANRRGVATSALRIATQRPQTIGGLRLKLAGIRVAQHSPSLDQFGPTLNLVRDEMEVTYTKAEQVTRKSELSDDIIREGIQLLGIITQYSTEELQIELQRHLDISENLSAIVTHLQEQSFDVETIHVCLSVVNKIVTAAEAPVFDDTQGVTEDLLRSTNGADEAVSAVLIELINSMVGVELSSADLLGIIRTHYAGSSHLKRVLFLELIRTISDGLTPEDRLWVVNLAMREYVGEVGTETRSDHRNTASGESASREGEVPDSNRKWTFSSSEENQFRVHEDVETTIEYVALDCIEDVCRDHWDEDGLVDSYQEVCLQAITHDIPAVQRKAIQAMRTQINATNGYVHDDVVSLIESEIVYDSHIDRVLNPFDSYSGLYQQAVILLADLYPYASIEEKNHIQEVLININDQENCQFLSVFESIYEHVPESEEAGLFIEILIASQSAIGSYESDVADTLEDIAARSSYETIQTVIQALHTSLGEEGEWSLYDESENAEMRAALIRGYEVAARALVERQTTGAADGLQTLKNISLVSTPAKGILWLHSAREGEFMTPTETNEVFDEVVEMLDTVFTDGDQEVVEKYPWISEISSSPTEDVSSVIDFSLRMLVVDDKMVRERGLILIDTIFSSLPLMWANHLFDELLSRIESPDKNARTGAALALTTIRHRFVEHQVDTCIEALEKKLFDSQSDPIPAELRAIVSFVDEMSAADRRRVIDYVEQEIERRELERDPNAVEVIRKINQSEPVKSSKIDIGMIVDTVRSNTAPMNTPEISFLAELEYSSPEDVDSAALAVLQMCQDTGYLGQGLDVVAQLADLHTFDDPDMIAKSVCALSPDEYESAMSSELIRIYSNMSRQVSEELHGDLFVHAYESHDSSIEGHNQLITLIKLFSLPTTPEMVERMVTVYKDQLSTTLGAEEIASGLHSSVGYDDELKHSLKEVYESAQSESHQVVLEINELLNDLSEQATAQFVGGFINPPVTHHEITQVDGLVEVLAGQLSTMSIDELSSVFREPLEGEDRQARLVAYELLHELQVERERPILSLNISFHSLFEDVESIDLNIQTTLVDMATRQPTQSSLEL